MRGIAGIRKHIIQYSYYDNEPAGDQFITFMISESGPVIMQHGFKIIKKKVCCVCFESRSIVVSIKDRD